MLSKQSDLTGVLELGDPATYCISVQGRVDERTVDHIGDARIKTGDGRSTTLIVKVLDQADLSGVLDTLYGLHLPILSVQLLNN